MDYSLEAFLDYENSIDVANEGFSDFVKKIGQGIVKVIQAIWKAVCECVRRFIDKVRKFFSKKPTKKEIAYQEEINRLKKEKEDLEKRLSRRTSDYMEVTSSGIDALMASRKSERYYAKKSEDLEKQLKEVNKELSEAQEKLKNHEDENRKTMYSDNYRYSIDRCITSLESIYNHAYYSYIETPMRTYQKVSKKIKEDILILESVRDDSELHGEIFTRLGFLAIKDELMLDDAKIPESSESVDNITSWKRNVSLFREDEIKFKAFMAGFNHIMGRIKKTQSELQKMKDEIEALGRRAEGIKVEKAKDKAVSLLKDPTEAFSNMCSRYVNLVNAYNNLLVED